MMISLYKNIVDVTPYLPRDIFKLLRITLGSSITLLLIVWFSSLKRNDDNPWVKETR